MLLPRMSALDKFHTKLTYTHEKNANNDTRHNPKQIGNQYLNPQKRNSYPMPSVYIRLCAHGYQG